MIALAYDCMLQDAPEDLTTYGDKGISADLAALLDHLSIPTVVVVGHDWGGMVAWRFTQFHPERVRAGKSLDCFIEVIENNTLNSGIILYTIQSS